MHDPKFDKEVQQKLQELSFSPSDAVWTNVERAVNGDRKRRTPVFWFWTLPAVALTVAGIWYFAGKGAVSRQAALHATPSVSSAHVPSTPDVTATVVPSTSAAVPSPSSDAATPNT